MNYIPKRALLALCLLTIIAFSSKLTAQTADLEVIDSLMNELPTTPYNILDIKDSTDYSKAKILEMITKVSEQHKDLMFVKKDEIIKISSIQKKIDNQIAYKNSTLRKQLDTYKTLDLILKKYEDGQKYKKELIENNNLIEKAKKDLYTSINNEIKFENIYYIKLPITDGSKTAISYVKTIDKAIESDAISNALGTSITSITRINNSSIESDSIEACIVGKISGQILKTKQNYEKYYFEYIYKVTISPNMSETKDSGEQIVDTSINLDFYSLLLPDSSIRTKETLDLFDEKDEITQTMINIENGNIQSDEAFKNKIENHKNTIEKLNNERTKIILKQIERNDTLKFVLKSLSIPHNPNVDIADHEISSSKIIAGRRLDSLQNLFDKYQESKIIVKNSGNETIIDNDAKEQIAQKVFDQITKLKTNNNVETYKERTIVVNKRVESATALRTNETIKDFDFISIYLVPGENSNIFVYPLVKYKLKKMKSTSLNPIVRKAKGQNVNDVFKKLITEEYNNIIKMSNKEDYASLKLQNDMSIDSTAASLATYFYEEDSTIVPNQLYESKIIFSNNNFLIFSTANIRPYDIQYKVFDLSKIVNLENCKKMVFKDFPIYLSNAKYLYHKINGYNGGILDVITIYATEDDPTCCPSVKKVQRYRLDINTGVATYIVE
jgi:hypothetical protein